MEDSPHLDPGRKNGAGSMVEREAVKRYLVEAGAIQRSLNKACLHPTKASPKPWKCDYT